jgi:hypothetical protein
VGYNSGPVAVANGREDALPTAFVLGEPRSPPPEWPTSKLMMRYLHAVTDEGVTIRLSWSESLVLFEWLARTERAASNYDGLVEDDAERIVLWDLHSELESKLAAPFSPAYAEALDQARARVRGDLP